MRDLTRVNEGDLPRLTFSLVHLHGSIAVHMEGEITGMQEIIRKMLFNYISLVSTANNKFIQTISAVKLEDMPQNRLSAYFNHRFGPRGSLLGEPCTQAAGQNNNFHRSKAEVTGYSYYDT